MAVTKAGIQAREKYNSKTYEDLRIRVPKGHKNELQAHVMGRVESLNAFVKRAIDEAVERDNEGKEAVEA